MKIYNSTKLSDATQDVEAWLRGEHEYQFAKFDAIYGDELVQRRDFIANNEIANKWQRSRVFRQQRAYLLATQQVLKVCAASRAVIVYDACINGENREVASERTFDEIHEHFDTLLISPFASLSEVYQPYEVAFPDSEPHAVFKRAGELAIWSVMEDWVVSKGTISLPTPGVSSGNL